MENQFATYSLQDVSVVIEHPDVGSKVLSEEGRGGQISISFAADMSSHTTSAGGYVVVNKITTHSGSVSLALAQNSSADLWMRKLCNYLKGCTVTRFALATLTIRDAATGQSYECTGVTPQKVPDIQYDQTAGTVQYGLLCAYITIK